MVKKRKRKANAEGGQDWYTKTVEYLVLTAGGERVDSQLQRQERAVLETRLI